jgi:DNA-binding MarR family transcriptional regulator
MVDMSSNTILDAYSSLRRELSLIFAAQLKDSECGYKQTLILYQLSRAPHSKPISMSDLATFSQSDPAATTRTVAALEKFGFVKRVQDETDNRKTLVELTKAGQRKAVHASEARKKIAVMVNETLSVKEREIFADLLGKVANGLKEKKKD